ncbi:MULTISPECIES: DmsC/YnfH family molybdoenzyme membrane anchor subunit [unclassified Adlercreutzia]|uniref:dimethyl sulfoxide reductase anchor subunit family protein n=1 Tax=unclassified Adlercreutzia TaxID=2636013 RepID=UPI0013EA0818|nr:MULTISPECIES: DmsC/YnfH family molybdoenzyme membrane anchor subunit [unclassified Adlercreutzia]
MEAVLAEMPLALFTTLSAIGAGAFVTLAVALATTKPSAEQLGKIDKMTAIPLAIILVSFIAAFFHLANVMNAPQVFAGVGRSPLSNEIAVGCVFTVTAVVYWALAVAGKLPAGARRGLSAAVAVLAVLYALFMGLAYMMNTIPSWNTVFSPLQMIGFALVGGAAVGVLVLALGGLDAEALKPAKTAILVVSVAGAVLGIAGVAGQAVTASGLQNALTLGSDLVSAAAPLIGAGVAGIVATCACTVLALRAARPLTLGAAACALAVVGILCARLAFYAMSLSIGLYVF